jgi:3-oxoacyl-[acyl-carrier-protein] synthase-3
MHYSKILGVGSYLPEKVLTNKDLEKLVDTSDAWIIERTGIKQRHIAADDESTTSMAAEAARAAIKNANLSPNDIDMLILATSTPDHLFPSSACRIQHLLGIPPCPAFDLSAACAGLIYALHMADACIKAKTAKNILIIGAEVFSRILNWKDRNTCILFGDGASAFVISGSDEPGIYSSFISSDGQYRDLLYVPNRLIDVITENKPPYLQMQGREVFKLAVKTLGKAVTQIVEMAGMQKSDIDWLVPHQANRRIIQAVASQLDMSMDQVICTVGEHGNTSGASIGLAFDVGVRDGKIKKGDVVLMESFGAGFVWGAALLKY